MRFRFPGFWLLDAAGLPKRVPTPPQTPFIASYGCADIERKASQMKKEKRVSQLPTTRRLLFFFFFPLDPNRSI